MHFQFIDDGEIYIKKMFPEAVGYDNNYTSFTTEQAFANILANARTIQQVGTYHITTAKRI